MAHFHITEQRWCPYKEVNGNVLKGAIDGLVHGGRYEYIERKTGCFHTWK
jgi:hypothetical protein